MLDTDLAMLYEVPTKALKQQVKRNIGSFPKDFMFELTTTEKKELVTNCDRLKPLKHSSVLPIVFTEQGVSMLSSVLRSEKAIQINIGIMRAFARYRALLRENEELKDEIRKRSEAFGFLLEKIDALHQEKNQARPPVGFKIGNPNSTTKQ